MILKESGRLGVGTTTPDELLHVAGNIRIDEALIDEDGDAGASGELLSATSTGTNWIDKTSIVDYNNGGEIAVTNRTLGNKNGFALGLLTDNIPRIHITGPGNVGIGTTSPGSTLEVAGDSRIEGNNGPKQDEAR